MKYILTEEDLYELENNIDNRMGTYEYVVNTYDIDGNPIQIHGNICAKASYDVFRQVIDEYHLINNGYEFLYVNFISPKFIKGYHKFSIS